MKNDVYAIDDGDGNQLVTGLSSDTVKGAAMRWANRLGVAVWYYRVNDERWESVRVDPLPDES